MTALEWDDSPEILARLGDLEHRVLYGKASDAELAEFCQLRDAHEAWIVTTPAYQAFCEETAIKLGADVPEFTARACEPVKYPRGSES